jgi:hypothetical protein
VEKSPNLAFSTHPFVVTASGMQVLEAPTAVAVGSITPLSTATTHGYAMT